MKSWAVILSQGSRDVIVGHPLLPFGELLFEWLECLMWSG